MGWFDTQTVTYAVDQVYSGGAGTIDGLAKYASAIVKASLTNVSGNPAYTDFATFSVAGFIGGASGIQTINSQYNLQALAGDSNVGYTAGDTTVTTIPLNGCDTLTLQSIRVPAGMALSFSVTATNEQLPLMHRTIMDMQAAPLMRAGGTDFTTSTPILVPIPITGNGVSIYGFAEANTLGTGNVVDWGIYDSGLNQQSIGTSVTLTVVGVANGKFIEIDLPHSLRALNLRLSVSAGSGYNIAANYYIEERVIS